jgi:UDP-glucose 4-epimerase
MNKNYIVVTGGAGFIGSNLIKFLLKKTNLNIISLDNYSTGQKLNHVKNKRVRYIRGENKNILRILGKYAKKIKVIFHFGEFSRIYQSFKRLRDCFNYNLLGTFEVTQFCLLNNIKIIYSASSSKFGNNGNDEHLSPYSWSKSKNIELIKNLDKWYGLKYEILFFYNVYGPGQITNHKMSAVIGIFETQVKKRQPLTVVKPGNQKRDFTHVNDIVEGCYLAYKKGKNSEYMLGTSRQFTILQVAKMFSKKIKFILKRKGERFGSFSFKHKTFKDLGYKPRIKIEDYIKNFKKINDIRDN